MTGSVKYYGQDMRESDTSEPTTYVGPDWLQEYLEQGGKVEDVSALNEWCAAHGIILEAKLSPTAGFASSDID